MGGADGEPELDLARVLCALGELDDPGSRAFRVGGGDWPLSGLVVRRGAEVHAYVNRCPHAGHPLNLRPHDFLTVDRSLILCCSHGALFEIATGRCVAGPCAGAALARVPVVVTRGYVLLAEGVPAQAPDD
ncbi:MAG: Rieske 2Fe-2S domain-containing protein [Proteobacteria bacterium]|nr:Rieske 2Fe-2S domain-containing protein [Pseudomonadota bacterium]